MKEQQWAEKKCKTNEANKIICGENVIGFGEENKAQKRKEKQEKVRKSYEKNEKKKRMKDDRSYVNEINNYEKNSDKSTEVLYDKKEEQNCKKGIFK